MKFTMRQARLYAGLTQHEVAKSLDIADLTYGKYERGENVIRVDQAYKFSDLVGIQMENIDFFSKGTIRNV